MVDFVNRLVHPELMSDERIECVFVRIVADRVVIAMVFLNRLHGYLIDEFKAGMIIVNREFIEDQDAWNINICSSLNILTSN